MEQQLFHISHQKQRLRCPFYHDPLQFVLLVVASFLISDFGYTISDLNFRNFWTKNSSRNKKRPKSEIPNPKWFRSAPRGKPVSFPSAFPHLRLRGVPLPAIPFVPSLPGYWKHQ